VTATAAVPNAAARTGVDSLSNWHATLRLCQFDIQQPMVKVYGIAFGLSDQDLATAARRYNERY
jgi:glutathione-regulated potassium-efflux system ancillary protein KefG